MRGATMQKVLLTTLALASLVSACAEKPAPPPRSMATAVTVDDTFGVDDVIDIRVMGEPELTGTYRVASDGTIDFPQVGRMMVLGKRTTEIQSFLVQQLKDNGYLVKPQVVVAAKEWNSRKVSVIGQVQKPGTIVYFQNMTLVDAVAAVGGFTPIAAKNNVSLTRGEEGRRETRVFPLGDIMEGRAPNVLLRPGDVIVVEERMF